jgi:hypothetical protein
MAHRDAVQVALRDIQIPDKSNLDPKRLHALENSYDSFEDQLNSSLTPIALHKGSPPYKIHNGRHSVFWAGQKGYTSVPALFI